MKPKEEQERIEALLKPRYKLVLDYPMNIDEVGTVYNIDMSDGHGLVFKETCDLYPHLFRKLEWWEEREVEEMPGYVKTNPVDKNWNTHSVEKVECFYGDDKEYISVDGLDENAQHLTEWFLPATEQDYTLYLTNTKR